ncbi:MAG: FAD-dependent monooxygenase [Burkholderiaceae bacterium]|nr:FAD-dependent monooxygenase [Burkholderiaceae bacterium]
MSSKPTVIVAGAGLGGLTAALALLRKGIDVEVHEQAPALGEVGAGVQISSNGTAALFALGLEAPVRDHGVQVVDKEIRLWNTGQTWSLFKRDGSPASGRYPFPMFMLHRKDLHGMLVDAVRKLKPDAIHLGRKCTGFVQQGARVRLDFDGAPPAEGDILVGADGLHSRVREQQFGRARAEFTGQVVWRGLVPMDRLTADQRRLIGSNWVGPHAHVTCYPVQRGEMYNFVGQVDRTDWQIESWVTEGSTSECLADFAGWHEDVQRMIRSAPKLFKWALFLRDTLPQWSVNRVTLLGDAAHATLPYLGQGACMAMEDGIILARCIAQWAGDPELALQRYQSLRVERTRRIVEASAAMTGTFHSTEMADAAGAQRYVDAQWNGDKVRERYDWIYNYDPNTVPLQAS